MKKIFTALIVSLIAISVCSAEYSISPGSKNRSMRFQIESGKKQTGTVFIRNTGAETISVRVYAADGKRTSSGNYAVKSSNEEQLGLGVWTTFRQNLYDLKPYEDREVQFTIALPQDLPPGVYPGGIAIEKGTKDESAIGGGMGVKINARVVSPFFVDVPGEKKSEIIFDSFQHEILSKNEHIFDIGITNKGNTAIVVKTKLFIEGWFGLYKKELTGDDLYLYRGDKTQYQIPWKDIPMGGNFTITAQVEYHENNIVENQTTYIDTLKKETRITIIPWIEIGFTGGLILILGGAVFMKKQRIKLVIKNSQAYNIQPGDTITSIAEKFGVNWKLIAKINHLTEPYSLEGKKQILIPPKKK